MTLSGQVHHFFTKVSSSNPQSSGISYFVFDSSASRACSSKSGNVDKELLNDIGNELKNENPYCKDLQQLGNVFNKVVLQLMPMWFLGW